MRWRAWLATFALGGCALIVPVVSGNAQQATPEETIKARQQHFKDIGKAAKDIVDQLKSGTIDKADVAARAVEIDTALKGIPTWFPAGTGPESGVKTAAKAEIWTQSKDFKVAYDNAQAAADKFVPIAASGDPAAIGAGFQALGQGCGGCHKTFRVKDEAAAH